MHQSLRLFIANLNLYDSLFKTNTHTQIFITETSMGVHYILLLMPQSLKGFTE